MECNTVERAIKTETDKRTEQKEWASAVGSCLTTRTVLSPPREGEPTGTGIRGTSFLKTCFYLTGRKKKIFLRKNSSN